MLDHAVSWTATPQVLVQNKALARYEKTAGKVG